LKSIISHKQSIFINKEKLCQKNLKIIKKHN
jgi:hypothetical protein